MSSQALGCLHQLCSLNLNHNSIHSLEGLRSCVNLRELYAANNKVKELTPLCGLTNLTTLSIFNNAVDSLDACLRVSCKKNKAENEM